MTSINPIFEPFIEAHRYKVAKGGRGSGKSWAIARLLVEAARRQPVRILCARELQNSISDSVIRLLEDTIEREGYSAEFEIQRSMIRHLGTNAEFMFYGIKNNPTKIKSLEGIDICWVEEAEAVTKESWDILIPTIRKPFSEIWVSFNPKNILDDTYQRFVVNPPDDICLLTVNYTDNPHFPEVLRLEMEECKRRNPTLYRHIWLGEPVSASDMAIIKREWLEAATDAHKKLGWKAKGAVVSAHDPSDTGPDAKGYASRHGSVVKRIAEGLLMDINEGADWATSLAIEDGADHYLWDGDGVGAGLRRQTTEAFSGKKITATMFKGSESPFDEDAPYQAGAWADEVVQGEMAQTTAENIPLAGTSGMRATQQEARSQLVQRFADKFGEYDPAVVIDSLKAKTSGIRRAAGNRLEQVQNAMAGVNIQPARAIQQIDTEISNLQKLGKVADNETISKLQSYRDELVRNAGPDGPVNLDLKQLSDLRSQFRMDVKGERPVLPNRSDAAIQRVYKAMTDDINGAIGQNLGNDTLRKYQQANAVYADEAAKLKNTRLKNVLMKGDLTPEVVNNMLFSKNKSEIKTLYNSVGRVGRAQMRNGIIGKAMEKSGGSPAQFLRQLNILQNHTGITFKGQDAAYLKGLKNYLQSTQQAAKAAVTTPTGQQTIPFIIGYGTAMNPATTGAAVSYGLLARAYESEPFRNAMLRMANTPRGSTAFEKAMQQAQKAINAMTQGVKSDALSE
ncbi:PBSX family phage terminase large subunit [Escherichia coli]|uniref:PBSX family phage terminase large subunit n=1 Tax=Escherichia coli TaxID=562 RepID=UPI00157D81B2|nr:PBSX family phage terminase large subunit [Escherichia coli]NUD72964.1 PBSX family phage terminase large subunit [Escherichia coli]